MRIFLIALALALVAPLCPAADISDLERFISEEMSKQEITALSVAVSHGDFSWSKGFGTADLEKTKDRRLADLAAELYPRLAATEGVKKRLAAIP